jgi:hypothetical protein
MLSRYVGFPIAGATAARMQAVSLLGNAAVSIPCAIGTWMLTGPSWLFLAIVGHFVVTLALGAGVVLAGRHSRLGERLSKYFRSGDQWGAALDDELASFNRLWSPTLWVCLSRALRLLQRSAMLAAVGVGWGALATLCSESINLVAGAVGDIIPMRLGVNEAAYAVASKSLGMTMGAPSRWPSSGTSRCWSAWAWGFCLHCSRPRLPRRRVSAAALLTGFGGSLQYRRYESLHVVHGAGAGRLWRCL